MSSGFQHKMYQYEVPPPPGAWDKIAGALDDAAIGQEFPLTLRNLSVPPPPSTWDKIQASLEEPVPTITKQRRIFPFLRYAAAATLIGLLAWGGVRLLNNSSTASTQPGEIVKKEETSEAVTPPSITNQLPKEEVIERNTVTADTRTKNESAPEKKRTYATVDVPARNKLKSASNFYFNVAPGEEDVEYSNFNTRGLGISTASSTPDVMGRYIVLMTPDGNFIRVSKKLSDLVCCVSGEEQDEKCMDQMKRWREKLANPSVNHSPGNFMDILTLLGTLQDNHN